MEVSFEAEGVDKAIFFILRFSRREKRVVLGHLYYHDLVQFLVVVGI